MKPRTKPGKGKALTLAQREWVIKTELTFVLVIGWAIFKANHWNDVVKQQDAAMQKAPAARK